ncbi:hypothetical protein MKX01_037251, partial [Papaver californicum]
SSELNHRGMGTQEEIFSQIDFSVEEKDKLVADVIRCVLFKNHQTSGCPIKREELTSIVTKTYRQRALPALVINEARNKLLSIFGYELKELQRARPLSANQRLSTLQKNLWQHLKRLGLLETDQMHPVLGDVKKALESLVQQRYLQKNKVNGPEGNILIYELAERALDESVNARMKEYISQINRVRNFLAFLQLLCKIVIL